MDHSHMDHGGMGGGMEDMCSMNMIFTWDYKNLCIVFRWWHIRSFSGLLISLVAIVALCAGYEAVRSLATRYETQSAAISAQQAQRTREDDSSAYTQETSHGLCYVEAPSDSDAEDGLLSGSGTFKAGSWADDDRQDRTIKGAFYAVQVFYSFFIMLLFMTYNGWVMLAVPVGAFLGFMLFGNGSASKSQACH